MKTARSIFFCLLASASLLAPVASQAETIFERFAPPLPPLPNIVIRTQPAPVYREEYRVEHHYHRPAPRYYYYDRDDDYRRSRHHRHDHRAYRDDDRRDYDRRWR